MDLAPLTRLFAKAPPKNAATPGSRWLGAFPIAAAGLVAAVALPRATVPRDVPLPIVDGRVVDARAAEDAAWAKEARATRLPEEALLVGTAIRELHAAEMRADSFHDDTSTAGDRLAEAVARARATVGTKPLLELRAVQADAFAKEVSAFEATGVEGDELRALAGPFVRSMREVGWCVGNEVLPEGRTLALMYEASWDAIAHLDADPVFALSIDERKLLASFALEHPHPLDADARSIEIAEQGARDDQTKAAVALRRTAAEGKFALRKIAEIGGFDPSYPVEYANGVVEYGVGRYERSAREFQAWLAEHPEGAYAARARNYLRAALRAEGDLP